MPAAKGIVEPFPGWVSIDVMRVVAENGSTLGATWRNGPWRMIHTEIGYRVNRLGIDSRGAPIVVANEVWPTMEAAVMWAELRMEAE